MSDSILTVLKFCLLALLYLFLMRVVLIVARELRGSGEIATPPAPAAVAPPASGRPSKRREWRLVVIAPETERGRAYPVDGDVTIGRGGGCTIPLMFDTFVSQVHARAFERDGTLWVEDAGSTNGTLVNSKKIEQPVKLTKGDRVQVGETVLEAQR
jgi:hypothetical protein